MWRGCAERVAGALNSPVERTALVTGLYVSAAGTALLVCPRLLYLLVPEQSISPGWVRLFGIVGQVFGVYYLGSVFASSFFHATVPGRLYLSAATSVLVAAGSLPPAALLLAAANGIGAISMRRALRGRCAEDARGR